MKQLLPLPALVAALLLAGCQAVNTTSGGAVGVADPELTRLRERDHHRGGLVDRLLRLGPDELAGVGEVRDQQVTGVEADRHEEPAPRPR